MRPSVHVLIPASIVADCPDLTDKTMKLGIVGRALAIFRVEKVCVYLDDDPHVRNQRREREFVQLILSYMETPQYLRKLLFPRRRELARAGALPPLRTPHHPDRDEKDAPGSFREGVVIRSGRDGSTVEIGLPWKGFTKMALEPGRRVTVRLGNRLAGGMVEVFPVGRGETGEYWGYEVLGADGIGRALDAVGGEWRIGTSRYGRNLYEGLGDIRVKRPKSVTIAFGGPYAGLHEICRRQGEDPESAFDEVLNTIPEQGTRTVRTEEAIIVTLGIVNALIGG
jgi:predicted SPOUT superfamily RNA methylase MTH1